MCRLRALLSVVIAERYSQAADARHSISGSQRQCLCGKSHLSAARWHVGGWPWHNAANIWGSALVCPYVLPLRDVLGAGSALQAPQVNNVSCNLFPPGFFQIIQTTAALNGGRPKHCNSSPAFKVTAMHHCLACGQRCFSSIFGSCCRRTVDISRFLGRAPDPVGRVSWLLAEVAALLESFPYASPKLSHRSPTKLKVELHSPWDPILGLNAFFPQDQTSEPAADPSGAASAAPRVHDTDALQDSGSASLLQALGHLQVGTEGLQQRLEDAGRMLSACRCPPSVNLREGFESRHQNRFPSPPPSVMTQTSKQVSFCHDHCMAKKCRLSSGRSRGQPCSLNGKRTTSSHDLDFSHSDGCALRRCDGKAWAAPIWFPLARHICKIGLRWLVPGVREIIFTFGPRWEGGKRKAGGAQLQGAASGVCASLEPCCCSSTGENLLKIVTNWLLLIHPCGLEKVQRGGPGTWRCWGGRGARGAGGISLASELLDPWRVALVGIAGQEAPEDDETLWRNGPRPRSKSQHVGTARVSTMQAQVWCTSSLLVPARAAFLHAVLLQKPTRGRSAFVGTVRAQFFTFNLQFLRLLPSRPSLRKSCSPSLDRNGERGSRKGLRGRRGVSGLGGTFNASDRCALSEWVGLAAGSRSTPRGGEINHIWKGFLLRKLLREGIADYGLLATAVQLADLLPSARSCRPARGVSHIEPLSGGDRATFGVCLSAGRRTKGWLSQQTPCRGLLLSEGVTTSLPGASAPSQDGDTSSVGSCSQLHERVINVSSRASGAIRTAKVIVSVKDAVPTIFCGKIKGLSGVSTKNFSFKRDMPQDSVLQCYDVKSQPEPRDNAEALRKPVKNRSVKLKKMNSPEIHILPIKKQRLAAFFPRKNVPDGMSHFTAAAAQRQRVSKSLGTAVPALPAPLPWPLLGTGSEHRDLLKKEVWGFSRAVQGQCPSAMLAAGARRYHLLPPSLACGARAPHPLSTGERHLMTPRSSTSSSSSLPADDATSLPVLDAQRPTAALRTQTNPLIPAQKTHFPQLLKSRYPTPARKIRSVVEPSEAFLHIWGEKLLTAKIFSAASRPRPPGSPGTAALRSQHGNYRGASKQKPEMMGSVLSRPGTSRTGASKGQDTERGAPSRWEKTPKSAKKAQKVPSVGTGKLLKVGLSKGFEYGIVPFSLKPTALLVGNQFACWRVLQHVHSHTERVGSAVASTATCTRPTMQYSSISMLHGSSATRAMRAASPPGAAAV
ncbi:Retinoic acid-induced protein 2 [Anas platyrhynchos]|uniref:Retinoic acid-induced protein 2 n=1 Tax=Anas platyrhynchos TaxID=8839 RepID=R0K6C4_ANAPL|nr:Retinoic acid-induced protein 2 [Anas platyrhynchos]